MGSNTSNTHTSRERRGRETDAQVAAVIWRERMDPHQSLQHGYDYHCHSSQEREREKEREVVVMARQGEGKRGEDTPIDRNIYIYVCVSSVRY